VDIEQIYANGSLVKVWDWEAKETLVQAMISAWAWENRRIKKLLF